MATNVSSTTFLSQYNDDYNDSDHYHRILFNNGRALQARELTQLQTIIQKEIERLAKFVVKEGAIFNNSGTLSSGRAGASYTYINVAALPSGYVALKNTEINYNSSVYATVKAVVPDNTSSDTPPGTLIVRLTKGDGTTNSLASDTTSVKTFTKNTVVTTTLGNVTINNSDSAVGLAALIETPAFDTFVAGHLVTTEPQTLVLNQSSNSFSGIVGFKVNQQVITVSDNVALYDNSGATPNLTSPGADRLKITLELVKKSDTDIDDIFYEVFDIKNGNISLIKTSDKTLDKIGDIINRRTQSISGNFVERKPGGMFNLTVEEDSASTDFLSVSISSGTAFVNGNRIEKDFNAPFRVRKPNDAATSGNLHTVTNDFISGKYGNYFLSNADSSFGMIGLLGDSYGKVDLYNTYDLGGTKIGSARLRNIDKQGADFRSHVFDVSLNTNYSPDQVRSFGTNATNYANVKPVGGEFGLHDRDENSLLFPMSSNRAYRANNVVMTVQSFYSGVKDSASISIVANYDNFADEDEWVYQVESSGELVTGLTIDAGGAGETTSTISGMPSGAYNLLTYETVTATRKTKTLTPAAASNTWYIDSNLSLSNEVFTLTKSDIYQFNKVIDDTTSEDITYKFIFDNGQRDNYYGPGKGRLKSGMTPPVGTINVQYRYFQHEAFGSDIGYFDAQSYVGVEWDAIPYFESVTGKIHRLSDVIDIRPKKGEATERFSGTGSRVQKLPRSGDTITIGTAQYWNPRLDVITLNPNGTLQYHTGTPSNNPVASNSISPESMILHGIGLNPYTLNKNDLLVSTQNNRGYKMNDIRKIDKRINQLERYTTLTATEEKLAEIQVIDPTTNTIRTTQGLSGDGFYNSFQSAIYDDDYRATRRTGQVRPKSFIRALGLTYDSDLSLNTTVIKGSTIWPKYTEEVMTEASQTVATTYENVNQFEIAQHVASGLLIPEGDYFTIRRLKDQNYVSQSNSSLVPANSTEISSQG